jgi:Tfp pilus assembly protein FimT
MSTDVDAFERCIRKCDERAAALTRSGCLAQARVAEGLAASFRSMLSQARAQAVAKDTPRCSCCGVTENLHRDFGSGGPWRCGSADCVVF